MPKKPKTQTEPKAHVIVYTQTPDGWIADAPEHPRCVAEGKSIEQARKRVCELLVVLVGALESDELVESYELNPEIEALRQPALDARLAAANAEVRAHNATRAAVHGLLKRGIKTMDAAELLGLTHQRVSQIAAG